MVCLISAVCLAQKPDPSGDWALPNFAYRLSVDVTNPGAGPIQALAALPVHKTAQIAPGFPGKLSIATLVEREGGKYPGVPVASQAIDLDGDGYADEFVFPVSLKGGEQRKVHIYYSAALDDTIVYSKRVHAQHAYGYNRQTVAWESEQIGYRTYGGFFIDVMARSPGHPGLFNNLAGYFAYHKSWATGRDVFHIGDTLGLGGLFLRRDGVAYRPPLNMPDYAHKPQAEVVPRYRVVADGPIRAIAEVRLDRWVVGEDEVDLLARYSIDAGDAFTRCWIQVLPRRVVADHVYEVGVGIRELPQLKSERDSGVLVVSGEQEARAGRLGLALYFDPARAGFGTPLVTREAANQTVVFHEKLGRGRAVVEEYAVGAAPAFSGYVDLEGQIRRQKAFVEAKVKVSGAKLEQTPQPERVDKEAN